MNCVQYATNPGRRQQDKRPIYQHTKRIVRNMWVANIALASDKRPNWTTYASYTHMAHSWRISGTLVV